MPGFVGMKSDIYSFGSPRYVPDMIWTLTKRGAERFSRGHPWVFSNELSKSPKGLVPGASVELRDPAGKFLAFGYGNPNSLIAFRALSRQANETDAHSEADSFDDFKRRGPSVRRSASSTTAHESFMAKETGFLGSLSTDTSLR